MEIKELLELANSGGNIALVVCVYFLAKVVERLSRIEKALSKYMEDNAK